MEPNDRVEKLLALLLLQQIKSATLTDKANLLSVAGFTNTEIADLLQTTTAVIAQSLYMARRRPKKPTRAKRTSK